MKFIIAIFLLALPLLSNQITISQYLEEKLNNEKIEEQVSGIEYLQENSDNYAFIKELSLTSELEYLDLEHQKYIFDMHIRNFGEKKLTTALGKNYLQIRQNKRDMILNKLMRNKYQTIIQVIKYNQLIDATKKLVSIYEDRINVFRSIDSLNNSAEIITLENNITALTINNIEREINYNALLQKVNEQLHRNNITFFDTTNFITPQIILSLAQSFDGTLSENNCYNRESHLEHEEAELLRQIDDKKISQVASSFGFTLHPGKFSSNSDALDNLKSTIGVHLKIRLPFLAENKHLQNKRRIKYLRDIRKSHDRKKSVKKKIAQAIKNITLLTKQYNYLQKRINTIGAQSSLKKHLTIDGVNPLVLLKINESITKSEIASINIKYELLSNYVNLLLYMGYFVNYPEKNFFDKAIMIE